MERAKRERLDALLADRDLAAAWFGRPASFTWLTGGDNVVDRAGAVGVAAAGYDGDGLTVVTANNEATRLRDEELPAGATVEQFEWYERSLAAAVADRSPSPAAADFDVPGCEPIDATALRTPLTDADCERYRALGRAVGDAVETVCREAAADDTEREVAARLRGDLAARGVETPVALVGGGERAPAYRHLTPQDDPVGEYAVVSVTASRDGLFASCTRTVAFDPPAWLDEHHDAAMTVEATAIAATADVAERGGTAGDVFAAIRDAYAAVGHPEEWRAHHQGGAAGYAGREWIATPDATEPVEQPMAYAWNPTVQGAKSEDTVLVTADGIEVLTATGDWPSTTVAAHDREKRVERHEPLVR